MTPFYHELTHDSQYVHVRETPGNRSHKLFLDAVYVGSKAGRFVLGIVLYLQYLLELGLPNTCYKYWVFPNTIQFFSFFRKK